MRLRIKEVRTSKGVSQEDLAKEIGISRPYLAQIETGARKFTPQKQQKIAAALKVDPSELMDFSAPGAEEEALIIDAFRDMTPSQRQSWLELARITLGEPQKKTE